MLADLAHSCGPPPSPWRDNLWPGFVKFLLQLIVDAHAQLKAANICQPTWRENQFSAALLLHIWQIRDAGEDGVPFAFIPEGESRILLEAIIKGKVKGKDDPDKAKRIDFAFRHTGMNRTTYFGVEAKVLTDKTIGTRKPGVSKSDYVNKGMLRFVDGRYSDGLQVGAMVGFIISGTYTSMASEIEREVITSKLPVKSNLVPVAVDPRCPSHYQSEHPRASGLDILLHHLFFQVFDGGDIASGRSRKRA